MDFAELVGAILSGQHIAKVEKTITLPEHIGNWKTGQAKRYRVSDLIKSWPEYREELPNLPELEV